MSAGIFQSPHKIKDLESGESSGRQSKISGEQPTIADLVLPGTGYNFSDEFACLLIVLGEGEGE